MDDAAALASAVHENRKIKSNANLGWGHRDVIPSTEVTVGGTGACYVVAA